MAFLDLEKAFDCIPHELAINVVCTKDRPYYPFCSSSAWTPSPLTFSRFTRGRSCSPMTSSWPKNNSELKEETKQWHNRHGKYGLHLNTEKTEYMECSLQINGTIYVGGVDLKKVQQFKYLCSVICSNGESLLAAPAHVNAAWTKWRQVTGVICNHWMPLCRCSQVKHLQDRGPRSRHVWIRKLSDDGKARASSPRHENANALLEPSANAP